MENFSLSPQVPKGTWGDLTFIGKAQQEISAENPPKHKQIIDFMKKVVYNTEK